MCGAKLGERRPAFDAQPTEKTRRSWRLKILLVAALGVLLAGVLFAYRADRAEASRAKLEEVVARDSELTEKVLQIDRKVYSLTHFELMDRCDRSVADRTALVTELRELPSDVDSELRDQLVAYFMRENDFVRSKRDVYYRLTDLTSMFRSFMSVYGSPIAHPGLDDYYFELKHREFKSNVRKKLPGFDQSINAFVLSYSTLAGEEVVLSERLKARGIRFKSIFSENREANLKLASDASQTSAWMQRPDT